MSRLWTLMLATALFTACYQTSDTNLPRKDKPAPSAADSITVSDAEALECISNLDCEGLIAPGPCQEAVCVDGRCELGDKSPGDYCQDDNLQLGDCQVGTCVLGSGDEVTCRSVLAPDGYPCGAAYPACGGSGLCDAGVCVDPCLNEKPCNVGTCTPNGCAFEAADDGEGCDDGDSCTSDDTCHSGECEGGPSICECATASDCADYEDGNLCNGTLTCSKGLCVEKTGSVVDCAPTGMEPCTTNQCNPDTGLCVEAVAEDNTVCDAGNACTAEDFCLAGECAGHGEITCEWNCSDEVDEDQDNLTDCDDSDCFGIDGCPSPSCGNGTCDAGEDCGTCIEDCGACPASCGDGTCDDNESCETCVDDCGTCPSFCGDGTCDDDETCETCVDDCGTCPSFCGDGACDDDETCETCVDDCGECPAVETDCGDNVDNDDDTFADCADDDCATSPLCGGADDCGSVISLFDSSVATGTVDVEGTTIGYADNFSGTCDPDTNGSPDAVWSFGLSEEALVQATVDFDGMMWPAMYIIAGSCGGGTEQACVAGTSGPLSLAAVLPAGSYFLVVDGAYAGDSSLYPLNLTVGPVPSSETNCSDGEDNDFDNLTDCDDSDCSTDTLCMGNICADALDINDGSEITGAEFDGQEIVVAGTTVPKGMNYEGSCAPDSAFAPESVYSFTLSDTLLVSISHDFAGSYFYPALYVRQDNCETGTEIACDAQTSQPAVISQQFEPGTYYVFADADYASDADSFTLTFSFTVPTTTETNCNNNTDEDGDGLLDCADDDCFADIVCLGKSCGSPAPLSSTTTVFTGANTGTYSVEGDTSDSLSTIQGSCSVDTAGGDPTVDAKERVYEFVVGESLWMQASLDFAISYVYPALVLFEGSCGSVLSESGCAVGDPNPGDPANIGPMLLSAGTYYLVADADYDNDEGAFVLDIVFSALTADETGLCNDGIDNDDDGLADCSDSDCTSDAACQ